MGRIHEISVLKQSQNSGDWNYEIKKCRDPCKMITLLGFNIELYKESETYRKSYNLEDWYNWKRKCNISLINKNNIN